MPNGEIATWIRKHAGKEVCEKKRKDRREVRWGKQGK